MTTEPAASMNSNEVALVTGAAGGIGDAVVTALLEQGVTVAALDRHADSLTTIATKPSVFTFATDVTDLQAVEATVGEIENQVGPIKYLVNAAGILRLGEAAKFTESDWTQTFAVNVGGVFHVSRAVARRMTERRTGSIVTVASNAAATPRIGMAAYAASKAAAAMFTKCLGLEVAAHGIRCNVVAPGSTDTPMLTSMWRDETGRETTIAGQPDAYRLGIPLGKIASPRDIADAVVFLLSDRAAHITMHDLTVDGGATLGA